MTTESATPNDSPCMAMVSDASVMTSGDRGGKNWGVLLLTKKELLFVTKSRFRSIGIFGGVDAPGIGLIVGLAEAITDTIRGSIIDRRLADLPPPEDFKKHPDTISIPYSTTNEIVVRPIGFSGDTELRLDKVHIYLNIPKSVRRKFTERKLSRKQCKEAYAHDIATLLTGASQIQATALALDWRHTFKEAAFFTLLVLGFIALLLFASK